MPTAPKQYRAYPSLPPVKRRDTRPPARDRGYDAKWARLRKWWIAKHPVCAVRGCTQAAQVVDHIVPISEDWSRRLDMDNLQSLCHSHHNMKTAADVRRRERDDAALRD